MSAVMGRDVSRQWTHTKRERETQPDEMALTWSHNNTPLTHTVIIHYRVNKTETTHTHTHISHTHIQASKSC